MSRSTTVPAGFLPADSFSYSTPAEIELNSEIPLGSWGWRHQPMRKSAIHKRSIQKRRKRPENSLDGSSVQNRIALQDFAHRNKRRLGKDLSMANRFKVDCRKYPSDKACTLTFSGALEEVVELGWLQAKMHHAHKDEEEKGIKDWIRSNAEEAND